MSMPGYAANQPTFPEIYERMLVQPLFRPFAETLLRSAGVGPGHSVLDVACGTGIVARLAAGAVGPRGRVVGVDLSPEMLAVAKKEAPAIDWREGNAAALPLRDGEAFDHVVCQQGLQFFTDKMAAAREMRRALGPGGRASISTWRSLAETPFFYDLHLVAERHLGTVLDQRHAFSDSHALKTLLTDAGFADLVVETVAHTVRFDDGASFARLNAMALIGMSESGKVMTDSQKQETAAVIAAESGDVLARYAHNSGIAFTLTTNVVSGQAA